MFHGCSCSTRTLTQRFGTYLICQVIDISPIAIHWDGLSGGFHLLWTTVTALIAAGVIVALWYNTPAALALGLLFAGLVGIGRLFSRLNSQESFHRYLNHDAAPP